MDISGLEIVHPPHDQHYRVWSVDINDGWLRNCGWA